MQVRLPSYSLLYGTVYISDPAVHHKCREGSVYKLKVAKFICPHYAFFCVRESFGDTLKVCPKN